MPKLFSKKYFLPLLFFFISVYLFLPSASRAVDILGTAFQIAGGPLIVSILKLILNIANWSFKTSAWLVQWTVSYPFPVSFTDPANNPLIEVGWTLLRDLTNMFFILGLAYIGLSTALNRAGFNTQKTFANILIIALLINFTPTICGLIVDFTNIISNFFFGNLSFEGLSSLNEDKIKQLNPELSSFSTNIIVAGRLVSLTIYGFLGSLVLLLFSILFFIRPLAIWLLVVFSPIAFFAWVFNETRKWFNIWWGQFLAWSIVAIPAGFFVYLSQQMLSRITKFTVAGTPDFAKIAVELAPYFLVLGLLIFGFFTALKISVAGAGAIIGVAGKAYGTGKGALKWGLKKAPLTGAAAIMGGTAAVRGLQKGIVGARGAKGKGFKEGWKGFRQGTATGFKETLQAPSKFYHRALETLHLERPGKDQAKTDQDINDKEKDATGKNLDYQKAMIDSANKLDRIAGLLAAIKDGNLKKLKDIKGLDNKQIEKIIIDALNTSPSAAKTIAKVKPEIALKVIKEAKKGEWSNEKLKLAGLSFEEKDAKIWTNLEEKLLTTATPANIKLWDEDTAEAAARSEAFHKKMSPAQLAAAAETHGPDFVIPYLEKREELAEKYRQEFTKEMLEKIKSNKELTDKEKQEEIEKIENISTSQLTEKFYEKHNKSVSNYLTRSPGAANLGLGFGIAAQKFEVSDEEIQKRLAASRPGGAEKIRKEEKKEEKTKTKEETMDDISREISKLETEFMEIEVKPDFQRTVADTNRLIDIRNEIYKLERKLDKVKGAPRGARGIDEKTPPRGRGGVGTESQGGLPKPPKPPRGRGGVGL